MLSRLGRFIRSRISRRPAEAAEEGAPQGGERTQTAQPAGSDPFAEQVLRRVRPLSVSRAPSRLGRSLAVSMTRPLVQAAVPRVRRDVPTTELPFATPARAMPAREAEQPATEAAADTQFFEGSTGDARWDALWAMHGTRRSAAGGAGPAPSESEASESPAPHDRPAMRPPQPGPRPGSPPVQRTVSPGERGIGPQLAALGREQATPGAGELDQAGPSELEPAGREAEGEPPATLEDGAIGGTTLSSRPAPAQAPEPRRPSAPARRAIGRTSGNDLPLTAAPTAGTPATAQRSQAQEAPPGNEPGTQEPGGPVAHGEVGRAAGVREPRTGTGPRRERLVPRSSLEELPTSGLHAQREQRAQPTQRAQPVQPVQHAPAPGEAPQDEAGPPREGPTALPSRDGRPPPAVPVQRAPEGSVEELAEGATISGPSPPGERGVERTPSPPRHEVIQSPLPPPARTGSVRQEPEPEAEPEVSTRELPEVTARDVATPGAAAAGQDKGRALHGQAFTQRASTSALPVQRASVERSRSEPERTGRESAAAGSGDQVPDEHVLLAAQPAQEERFAPPQPVQETSAQPAAGAVLERQPPAGASAPTPGAAAPRTPAERDAVPSPEAGPHPSPAQPARESRASPVEAPLGPAGDTAHAQVGAAAAAWQATRHVVPTGDGQDAGLAAPDRRTLLRQALQPRIVPTVVQAAPAGAAESAGAAPQGTAPGAEGEAQGEPDIESLARDVYRILRRRLLVEQERDVGRR